MTWNTKWVYCQEKFHRAVEESLGISWEFLIEWNLLNEDLWGLLGRDSPFEKHSHSYMLLVVEVGS